MISAVHSVISVLLLGATVVSAQSTQLTQSCKTALLNVAIHPEASSCLNTQGIMNSVLDSKKAQEDPMGTLKTWSEGMCASGWCSNQTLTDVAKNLTSGCAEDMGALTAATAVYLNLGLSHMLEVYPTARKIACLKDTQTNTLCTVSSLSQNATFEDVFEAVSTVQQGGFVSADLKESCTPCIKAAYSVARADFPGSVGQYDQSLTSVCGAGYADGSIPAGVTQTAVNSSAQDASKSKSSAIGVSSTRTQQISAIGFAMVLGLVL